MTTEQFKSEFHHTLPIIVAWSDMDALAHVNNAKYFTYLESARVDFLQSFQFLMPMPRVGVGPILAYIDCQFIIPITFPDEVLIGSRVIDVGSTSVKLEQAVYSTKLENIAASSKSVLVLINYGTGEKVRVPDSVRDLIYKKSG